MSGIGIDFGCHSSVIALARKKGIDIIANDVSNRLTPSVVVFGDDRRYIGESGGFLDVSNYTNSIWGLKRLIERMCSDEDMEVEKIFSNVTLVKGDDNMVSVMIKGEKDTVYSFVQLTAMFFSELNKIVYKETKTYIKYAVISCPIWYTERQKRGLIDACYIMNIEPLAIMNDLTAASLLYGMTRPEISQGGVTSNARLKRVLIIDMGHSSLQACVTDFFGNYANVISQTYERNVGGRNIDNLMAVHYAGIFNEKYKLDILSNRKAMYRLTLACQRVKKILSSNLITQLNVECLLEGNDFVVDVKREEFEAIIQGILPVVSNVIQQALSIAKCESKDIDAVELVGGSTRVPLVRSVVTSIFEPSKITTTLNPDEAIARGCALQCAINSPLFKVREYTINDFNPLPVELFWDTKYAPKLATESDRADISVLAFPVGASIPSTKKLTIKRVFGDNESPSAPGNTYDFVISVRYNSKELKSLNTVALESNFISSFSISGIRRPADGSNSASLKIILNMNQSGVVSVLEAFQYETVVREVPCSPEPVPATPPPPPNANGCDQQQTGTDPNCSNMDVSEDSSPSGHVPEQNSNSHTPEQTPDIDPSSQPNSNAPPEQPTPVSPPKTKLVTTEVKYPLNFTVRNLGRSSSVLNSYIEIERSLTEADKRVIETGEVRNALEELILNSRECVSSTWEPFIDPKNVPRILETFDEFESWLYGDGEGSTKEEYLKYYDTVKKYVDTVSEKYVEFVKKQEEEMLAKKKELERLRHEEEMKKKEEEEIKKKKEEEKKVAEQENGEMMDQQPDEQSAEPFAEQQNEQNGGPQIEELPDSEPEIQP